MRIKILRNTVANKTPVFIGEVHDVPDIDARFLIAIGKAEKFDEEKSLPKIETADLEAGLETTAKPRVKNKE